MKHTPRGTVRRSSGGRVLVREVRGDQSGWKMVSPHSDDCVFVLDGDVESACLQWPIIWCPDAEFHEQDNIRRAQGGVD